MSKIIGLVNTSTKVLDSDAALIARAINAQLIYHIAPMWGRLSYPVVFYPGKTVPSDIEPVVLKDSGTEPNALGFHFERDGVVQAEIDVDPILGESDQAGVLLSKDILIPSVSSVVSHEIAELFIDWDANVWADGPQIPQGAQYAYETADPVQGLSYLITLIGGKKVQVSDFVGPNWFDPEATDNFDHLGHVKAPFTLTPGGYMIIRNGTPGSESQVFGEHVATAQRLVKAQGSRVTKRIRPANL